MQDMSRNEYAQNNPVQFLTPHIFQLSVYFSGTHRV